MDFDGGWDSLARLVDGRWVERRPRRPDVVEQLRRETRLMPWLAPRLPLPVPVPEVVSEEPFVVRHVLVPGEPLEIPEHGHQLGLFLRALHDCPADEAIRLGVPRRTHHETLALRRLRPRPRRCRDRPRRTGERHQPPVEGDLTWSRRHPAGTRTCSRSTPTACCTETCIRITFSGVRHARL
ncbi:phosphotransferase [Saccharothrix deserti]|uniref:phosphotransferase n=1 Tax=Saccharothrix deserti TaxID=2593674 RepID=UPI00131C5DB2|nr:phosphotransferase [Saccharothrix deserti]